MSTQSMPATKSTTTDEDEGLTDLAKGIKTDEPHDTRSCPHGECHGSLTLTESDKVVCNACRVTPSGVYLPLPEPTHCSTTLSRMLNCKGQQGENGGAGSWTTKWMEPHRRYDNSDSIRLAGGYENVYDADDEIRPNGVTEEYTFNLSKIDGDSTWSGSNE